MTDILTPDDAPEDGRPEAAHETFEAPAPTPAEVEEVWTRYWLPMLSDGGVERLKGELYDFWRLVNEARKVYRHVTGGATDDLAASADGIIAMSEHRIRERMEPLQVRIRELEAELRVARGMKPRTEEGPVIRVPFTIPKGGDDGEGQTDERERGGRAGGPDGEGGARGG